MDERRNEGMQVSERGGNVSGNLELENLSEGHIALVEQAIERALRAELHDHDQRIRADAEQRDHVRVM